MHPKSAGDVDRLSRHIVRFVGSEERDDTRDIVGQANPPKRNLSFSFFGCRNPLFARTSVREVTHGSLDDRARAHRIYIDAQRRQFQSQRLSQADHGELG